MPRQIAEVRSTKLYLPDGETIKLDSKSWFDWLEVNHAFRYRLNDSTIVEVRKEQMGRGKFYWRMHHKVGSKRLKLHLTTSAKLTGKILLVKATEVIFNQTEMNFGETEPKFPEEIAPTLEIIRQRTENDLRQLEKNYRLAIELLTTQAIQLDLIVDSENLVRRVMGEVDHKNVLNLDNLSINE